MSILCHVLARGRGGYVLSSAVRCSCLRFAPQTEARVQVSKVFKNASAPDLVAPKQDIETLRILNAKGNDYRQSQVFVVQTGMVQDSQRKPHCGLSASAKLRSVNVGERATSPLSELESQEEATLITPRNENEEGGASLP